MDSERTHDSEEAGEEHLLSEMELEEVHGGGSDAFHTDVHEDNHSDGHQDAN